MQYVKLAIIFSLRIIFRVFHLFPVCENRILFLSYRGKEYSCNPKYLFEYIYKNYGNTFQYIWCINNKKIFPNEYKNIIFVKYHSIKYIWYVLTSKYYINNIQIEPIFPTRRKQLIVNTWHGGGAYKRIDLETSIFKKIKRYLLVLRNIRKSQNIFVITSCEKFAKVFLEHWEFSEEKCLKIGMPRNDILFSNFSFKQKIFKYYNINQKPNIILYAPTYRGVSKYLESYCFSLKLNELIMNTKIKFKKEYILFYRGHRSYSFDYVPDGVVFASDYPDMQELLCSADILITDYSSAMWDFSLTYKPCFIYAPDAKKYQRERGFYTPIEDWPFPFAETNEQLMENILKFDEEKYKKAVKKHHIDLGSYENGTACEQFCRIFS